LFISSTAILLLLIGTGLLTKNGFLTACAVTAGAQVELSCARLEAELEEQGLSREEVQER
jgi:hypothetical protein